MIKHRAGVLLLVAAGLVSLSGASCPYSRRPIDDFASLPPTLPPNPTLDQVIQVVNGNTSQIRSISAAQATLSGSDLPTTLRGNLAFERPQRFRLVASSVLGQELDLGSNDELFWFWARRAQPPRVYYCRHAQFATSPARQALLVDPYWMIEALGISGFDPTLQHQGPKARPDGRLEIQTARQTPSGPSTKITVVDGRHGLVLEQKVFDCRGQLVAAAMTTQHRRDKVYGLATPTVVDLWIPAQKATLRLNLGDVEVNRTTPNPEQLWAMPSFEGWQPFDLCNPNLMAPPGSQPPAFTSREPARNSPPAGMQN
jgi:hypothetical protein